MRNQSSYIRILYDWIISFGYSAEIFLLFFWISSRYCKMKKRELKSDKFWQNLPQMLKKPNTGIMIHWFIQPAVLKLIELGPINQSMSVSQNNFIVIWRLHILLTTIASSEFPPL